MGHRVNGVSLRYATCQNLTAGTVPRCLRPRPLATRQIAHLGYTTTRPPSRTTSLPTRWAPGRRPPGDPSPVQLWHT
jgi:hypothetical protein